MAYSAPSITAAGLSVPAYADILAELIAQFQSIYGQATYLGYDSADYQWISSVSLKMADLAQALMLVYNARSPLTAIGSDLDGIVKLNGLVRKSASFSTAALLIAGAPGATITNGVAQDVNGNSWNLPTSVTIPNGGSVTVTGTAANPGNINALAGTITTIATPTAGWAGVTNAAAAIPGQAVEADSALRARQALSVALPSSTRLAGTQAAIAAISGVTRYNIVENPTGAVDGFGNPPHSITCVVEGGDPGAIAQAIYNNKSIGCFTNGTASVTVTDPNTGYHMSIGFDQPKYVPIFVTLNVHGLNGFTTATQAAIQSAVVAYLNSLQIGETVVYSSLYGAALSVMPNPSIPQFSIRGLTSGTSASPAGTSDISMTFNQVAQGATGNVVVNIV